MDKPSRSYRCVKIKTLLFLSIYSLRLHAPCFLGPHDTLLIVFSQIIKNKILQIVPHCGIIQENATIFSPYHYELPNNIVLINNHDTMLLTFLFKNFVLPWQLKFKQLVYNIISGILIVIWPGLFLTWIWILQIWKN